MGHVLLPQREYLHQDKKIRCYGSQACYNTEQLTTEGKPEENS
jgi:hypothetical protein